ncbi:hypothetical protein PR048_018450 [Dryococelus australis]|uniref:Uncharacterized protein n=1 Tax=Dryococelus australis TaxID=614101 RepID=A0ABQ9HCH9_9NEOP|nr:hypothetical protein PR048_018450 [Dryococelus australis]
MQLQKGDVAGGNETPQPYVPPSEQQVSEPRKYTGGAIPSRSFRILQAMTASPDDSASDAAPNSHVDYGEAGPQFWGQHPSHYPPPPYWGPPEGWWGYYPPPDMEGQSQPPYWDPYSYSAMCAYMAEMNAAYGYPPMHYPPVYSPHHFASPVRRKHHPNGSSDSDEYSGYSSTDEMAFYGAKFARNAAMAERSAATPSIIVTPSVPEELTVLRENMDETPTPEKKEEEETSGSDTEVEDNNSDRRLKAIRSVSDISIYKSGSDVLSPSSDANDEETEHEEDTEEEDEDEDEHYEEVQNFCEEQLPHQLSIIFEESEFSDACTRHDEDSSTATLDESDVDADVIEAPSSTVTVCLPLKLKFSLSENNEEVTTVIVGDSQVKHLESGNLNHEPLPSEAENHSRNQQDVSITIAVPSRNNSDNKIDKHLTEEENVELPSEDTCCTTRTTREVSVSDMECYETAESDSDVSVCLSLPLRRRSRSSASPMGAPTSNRATPTNSRGTPTSNRDTPTSTIIEEDEKVKIDGSDSPVSHGEDDSSSTTSGQTVKLTSRADSRVTDITKAVSTPDGNAEEDNEDSSSSISSSEEEEEESEDDTSSSSSTRSFIDNEHAIQKENNGKVEPVDATEIFVQKVYDLCTKENGEGAEVKTMGEESEEDDSGVTSDMSRQISDADTEPDDASKLTRYQRASTHSRLFKLLQEECEKSDDEDEEEEDTKSKPGRREQLTLPLHTLSDPDSLSSSSGVGSPASPTITDRLVKELVHSLLQRKKGKRLKKLPFAKLHAAALRVLQEDMDPYDTGSSATSEECSPVRHPAETGQANTTAYGANYYDYCDYYNSWATAASYYGRDPAYEYDIVPSRAFKLLQGGLAPGSGSGSWAKCPRIPGPTSPRREGEGRVTAETESQDHACAT